MVLVMVTVMVTGVVIGVAGDGAAAAMVLSLLKSASAAAHAGAAADIAKKAPLVAPMAVVSTDLSLPLQLLRRCSIASLSAAASLGLLEPHRLRRAAASFPGCRLVLAARRSSATCILARASSSAFLRRSRARCRTAPASRANRRRHPQTHQPLPRHRVAELRLRGGGASCCGGSWRASQSCNDGTSSWRLRRSSQVWTSARKRPASRTSSTST